MVELPGAVGRVGLGVTWRVYGEWRDTPDGSG